MLKCTQHLVNISPSVVLFKTYILSSWVAFGMSDGTFWWWSEVTFDVAGTSMATPGIFLMGPSLVGSVGRLKDSLSPEPSQVRWCQKKDLYGADQQLYAATVWVDDMFMGTALLAAWSRISGQLEHLHFAAEQVDLVSLSGLVLKIIFIS